jgi:galactokinase
LSSSAALSCSVAIALDELNGLNLASSKDGRAILAKACIMAENDILGAPTGGMDQSISLFGQKGYALLLNYRKGIPQEDFMEQIPFNLGENGLALLAADTRVKHELNDGGYAQRRKTCERAAEKLGFSDLRELYEDIYASDDESVAREKLEGYLEKLGNEEMQKRVRHVVSETWRAKHFSDALKNGEMLDSFWMMNQSHISLRDDFEVSCEELDVGVDTALETGALAARMTGGGFGGSFIAIVKSDSVDEIAAKIKDVFLEKGFVEPYFIVATPFYGAKLDEAGDV